MKGSGSYSSASWTKLELNQAMLGHVEAIGQVYLWAMWLVLRSKCPPQQDQDFKWVSASYVGGQVQLRWCHLGANFGEFGAVLKAMWDHFGPCCFGIVKSNPKIRLRNAPPGPEGETEPNQKSTPKR